MDVSNRIRSHLTTWLSLVILTLSTSGLSASPTERHPHSKAAATNHALTLAVAANFHSTLKKIVDAYQQRTAPSHKPQRRINLVSAASGQLYHQITQGAPFDLYFSATPAYIDALQNAQLVATGTAPQQFAIGRLALWAPDAQDRAQISAWLHNPAQHRHTLALANPTLAPFGLAAQETLQHLGLATPWQRRTVRALNANQTYHFIVSRAVSMGFTSLAHLKQHDVDPQQYWLVPQGLHTPILQHSVILKRSESKPAAHDFFAFLASPTSQQIITQAGYQISVNHTTSDSSP